MIEVRMAENEVDVVRAAKAYMAMHAEGDFAHAPLSPMKMLGNLFALARDRGKALFLAMDGEEVAGVLSLAESGYWFSETGRFIEDKGLYVLPAYQGGEALKGLLAAAIETSEAAGLPVYITINSGRRKRGGRSQWERTGATLGYINRGATLAHYPKWSEDP